MIYQLGGEWFLLARMTDIGRLPAGTAQAALPPASVWNGRDNGCLGAVQ